MRHNKGVSAGTVVLLCLSAAAIGAGAALLLTPQSGRRSQQQLRRYGRRAQNSLHEFVEEATEAVSKSIEKAQEFLQAKKSTLPEAIAGTRDCLKTERKQTSEEKKR